MTKKTAQKPADYILPLYINGLEGRVLHMPASKKNQREILFVYGHHSSLERWWGLMLNLNQYGAVTMPDLPGFGGMDSFYKIGEKPSIDTLADYLAAFVKMRYKNKRVTIAGMSLGFVIATRMLQRYPELIKKVDMLVSIAGFSHKDDFIFSWWRRHFYLAGTRFFSYKLPASFFRYVGLHPWILKAAYSRTHNAKNKFQGLLKEEVKEMMKFEIKLWHDNDVRTYMRTAREFLKIDNTKIRVDLPVHHVAVEADRYFDSISVEQHMRMIFREFHLLTTVTVGGHAPSVIADAKSAAPFVPPELRKILTNKLK